MFQVDMKSRKSIYEQVVAYRELEHQGYIYTVTGLGCFVKERDEMQFDEKRFSQVSDDLKFAVKELMFMGITSDEVKEKVDEVYSEGSGRA